MFPSLLSEKSKLSDDRRSSEDGVTVRSMVERGEREREIVDEFRAGWIDYRSKRERIMNVIAHGTWYFARSFILARDAINIRFTVRNRYRYTGKVYAMVVGGGVFSRPIPLIFTSDLHVEAVYRKAANYRQFIGLNASIGLSRIHRAVPSMGKRDLRFLGSTPPLEREFFPLFFISFYRRKVFGGKRRMIGGTRFGVKNRETRERGDEKSRFIRSTLTF